MKRILFAVFLLCCGQIILAQGLRHSVCIVKPIYDETDKSLFSDYGLYTARAGFRDVAQTLNAYKNDDLFGSGVVVAQGGKKYVVTNLHIVGYAKTTNVIFQLHDKTLNFTACPVVHVDSKADLAAIELPETDEVFPLPIFEGEIVDDMSIVAAGFPELAGRSSWQMTRGSISNARVDIDTNTKRTIQHTAAIDPGSSGGPLLYKNEENKYTILGINTWKAFYRDGVGLAIGKEDIEAFMSAVDKTDYTESRDISPVRTLSGEQWLYVFRQMPDSIQKQIKDEKLRLPLDPVLHTITLRDSIVGSDAKKAKHYELKASHIINDLDHRKHVRLVYDNYLGSNQQAVLQFGYDWLGFLETGVQISALFMEAMTEDKTFGTPLGYKTCVGAIFGFYAGGQLPINVGKFLLVPRITQSAGVGPMKTGNVNGGFSILADTRIGLDWRIPFNPCDLVLGVHYDMNWLWSPDKMNLKVYKPQSNKDMLNQYLQHGIGVTIGMAW